MTKINHYIHHLLNVTQLLHYHELYVKKLCLTLLHFNKIMSSIIKCLVYDISVLI